MFIFYDAFRPIGLSKRGKGGALYTQNWSVPSVGGVRIADKVRPSFESTSRRAKAHAVERRWAIELCAKLDNKKKNYRNS